MVNTRPTGPGPDDRVRTGPIGDGIGRPPVPGQPGRVASSRPRIPTLAQLAALLVNGILVLPRNYRRGMFLDILV